MIPPIKRNFKKVLERPGLRCKIEHAGKGGLNLRSSPHASADSGKDRPDWIARFVSNESIPRHSNQKRGRPSEDDRSSHRPRFCRSALAGFCLASQKCPHRGLNYHRSEERRGKECRSRWSPYH